MLKGFTNTHFYTNLYDFSTGKRAMACFNNLKKKFMRKKKDFRDASGM